MSSTYDYQLYVRPLIEGDEDRQWRKTDEDTWLYASAAVGDVNTSVGEDLEQALQSLGVRVLPVPVSGDALPPSGDNGAGDVQELSKLREKEEFLDQRVNGLICNQADIRGKLEELDGADGQSDEKEQLKQQHARHGALVARAQQELSTVREQIEASEAYLERTRRRALMEGGDGLRSLTVTDHATVAVALQKTTETVDRALNWAMRHLLDTDETRVRPLPDDPTCLEIDLPWQFADADTGELFEVSRTVQVPRNKPRRVASLKTAPAFVENRKDKLARLYLGEGLSRREIERRFRLQFPVGDVHNRGYQILVGWLTPSSDHEEAQERTRTVPDKKLRQALLDAPPLVRRIIYQWVIDGKEGLDHLIEVRDDIDPAYIDHLISTYAADNCLTRDNWGKSWAGSTHEFDRRVLEILKEAPQGRLSLREVVAASREWERHLTLNQVKDLAKRPPPTRGGSASAKFGQPPAVAKGEWRGRSDVNECDVWLVACPRCGGKATHALWTPETDPPRHADERYALICPTCRHAPWSDFPFPEDYLKLWSGCVNRVEGTTGVKEYLETADSTRSTCSSR